MANNQDLDNSVKFRVEYKWPKQGSSRDCPKCNDPMQLQPNLRDYYGRRAWSKETDDEYKKWCKENDIEYHPLEE